MKPIEVVMSVAGRDKNSLLAVIGECDGFVLVADGKARPLERPKRKNSRHLISTGRSLNEKEIVSNKSLRRALKHCEL